MNRAARYRLESRLRRIASWKIAQRISSSVSSVTMVPGGPRERGRPAGTFGRNIPISYAWEVRRTGCSRDYYPALPLGVEARYLRSWASRRGRRSAGSPGLIPRARLGQRRQIRERQLRIGQSHAPARAPSAAPDRRLKRGTARKNLRHCPHPTQLSDGAHC